MGKNCLLWLVLGDFNIVMREEKNDFLILWYKNRELDDLVEYV